MLSPSCRQGFSTCCLVDVSPRCGFPVVSQMWSPNRLPVVSQLPSRCFPDVVSKLLPGIVFHNSQLSSRIGLPIVSKCLPLVTQLFPICLSDVVSHLSRLSCKCGLPIVSQLSSTCLPQRPIVSQMWFPNYFPIASTCFPVTSQMWSKSLPIAYRSLEFEPVTAVGLQSRVIFLL